MLNDTVEDACKKVFGVFADANFPKDAARLWPGCSGGIPDFLYGGPGALPKIQDAASSTILSGLPQVVPLYVLAYIFDGDELSSQDMDDPNAPETAQYSCHLVALVLEPSSRTVAIMDPNGGLVPGGSMEFLSMPPRLRPTQWGKATTAFSSYDFDQTVSPFHIGSGDVYEGDEVPQANDVFAHPILYLSGGL